jgi:hypothetical protein
LIPASTTSRHRGNIQRYERLRHRRRFEQRARQALPEGRTIAVAATMNGRTSSAVPRNSIIPSVIPMSATRIQARTLDRNGKVLNLRFSHPLVRKRVLRRNHHRLAASPWEAAGQTIPEIRNIPVAIGRQNDSSWQPVHPQALSN